VKDWLCGHGVAPSAIHTRVVDVSDPESVSNAAAEQLKTLGPAHIVVSNAAIVNGQRVLDAQPAQITRAFGVNVLAHFWCARAFVPQMLQASPHAHADAAGVFATIGSLMAELPAARLADYCASKAATAQLHECLRWELGGDRGELGGDRREPRGEVRLLHVQPYLLDTVLFAGGTPFRYAWMRRLVQPLKAATVAHRTVRAIESGSRERLVLPWMFKWLPTILQCLHTGLRDAALVFAGAACAMDGFVGRLPADRKER
jgi:NAD(P)-dependent dehydrogenase (short-subunit alcohol dehydrogenase family)